ncbi:MAG: hypothetical protein EZS28_026124, partial [Streblomastix strix]
IKNKQCGQMNLKRMLASRQVHRKVWFHSRIWPHPLRMHQILGGRRPDDLEQDYWTKMMML